MEDKECDCWDQSPVAMRGFKESGNFYLVYSFIAHDHQRAGKIEFFSGLWGAVRPKGSAVIPNIDPNGHGRCPRGASLRS